MNYHIKNMIIATCNKVVFLEIQSDTITNLLPII